MSPDTWLVHLGGRHLEYDLLVIATAARLLEREPALEFDPVSMCVMDEFDTARFAQVPY